MGPLEFAPLPLDFVAVRGASEVAHFAGGRALDAPRAGARIVLHAGLDGETLRNWQATGALCIPAARLLALLAPDEARREFASARELQPGRVGEGAQPRRITGVCGPEGRRCTGRFGRHGP